MSSQALPCGDVFQNSKIPPKQVRLAYFVSHPIQYQAPLLRRIAQQPEIDLTVFFGSDFSTRGYRDEGFGIQVQWDVPLVEGYKHQFLPVIRDNGTEGTFNPINYGVVERLSGFDVAWVHGYATVAQMHAILAAKALGLPVLVRSDSQLKDRPRSDTKMAIKKIFFTALRRIVDGVLVTGTLNREYWQHYTGDHLPLFLLPYAVDNHWFQQQVHRAASTRADLQAELHLDPTRQVILFASKLQTRKHCNDLIAAYARLIAGSAELQPYLLIVGDGEERAALEQQARDLNLQDVRFCGFRNQTEMPRFLELATVFVLPSRHEPWGLIVNEAMNAGVPVVVSDDVGCHPDLVTDGVEGFVYPVRDIDALTMALRRVLSTPGTAATMGRRARARIDGWGFEQDIQGLKQAIASVTRGKRASADLD